MVVFDPSKELKIGCIVKWVQKVTQIKPKLESCHLILCQSVSDPLWNLVLPFVHLVHVRQGRSAALKAFRLRQGQVCLLSLARTHTWNAIGAPRESALAPSPATRQAVALLGNARREVTWDFHTPQRIQSMHICIQSELFTFQFIP